MKNEQAIYNYLSIFMSWRVESKIQVNTRFQHFNSTQILDSNIVTQLEYSISKFWLKSSLDELKTWLDVISLIVDDDTWSVTSV